MYPAKLKACLEGTDVAGIHRYFFASFDNRGSLWLFSFHHGDPEQAQVHNMLNIVIVIKHSYHDVLTYHPGLLPCADF